MRDVVLALVVLLSPVVMAQTEKPEVAKAKKDRLEVGSPAPALDVSKWVKGKAVPKFEAGQVYVIDCWATWCGPCIRAIPHMTEIQKKHRDHGVHVVGVSLWESKPSGVEPWVAGKGDEMGYTVAMDSVPAYPEGIEEGTREAQRWAVENGKVSQKWMSAAGRNGIPTVFIVDRKGNVAWIGHPMNGMDDALSSILDGTWTYDRARTLDRFQGLLREKKVGEALALFEKHESFWKNDAQTLNMVAWTIVDPEGTVKEKNLDLAFRAADRANELTEGTNAAILDTLARVHCLQGHIAKAIAIQEAAVKHADPRMKADLERALEEYRKLAGEEL
ncbi:MAG: redoxin family protein [Planctomycetes bacterium]|nr:redoxin family protein [Planctomycetota bacterium]